MEEEQKQQQDFGEIKALFKVWTIVFISLSYTYYIVSKLPKGKFRLLSLLPVFSLFSLLPLYFSTPTTSGNTGFFLTWLANSKLLLFCFNLGPLSHDFPSKSLFRFILVASFPIKIIPPNNNNKTQSVQNCSSTSFSAISPNNNNDKTQSVQNCSSTSFSATGGKKRKLPLSLWSRYMIYSFLVVVAILSDYNKTVHKNVLLGIYCCVVYLNLEIILGLCNKVVGSILGVELSPPFDEPYLSTSLQDFWGRRWNLMVSDVLHDTVYYPVRSFWKVRLGRKWAQALGVMAAFVVSGLMHELLFYYITRASPTGEVTCFFLLHGVCLVVEIGLKDGLGLGRKWRLHWALTGPLTIGFVVVTGFWLFFPQFVRNEVDVRSLEEVKAVGRFLKGLLGKFTS